MRDTDMASSKDYLAFIMDQLSLLDDVSYRAMMSEYIIYYHGKVIGGIYDDRFLVKDTKAARVLMPMAELELPYEGAKEMLPCTILENREMLCRMIQEMYGELPEIKKRKRKSRK